MSATSRLMPRLMLDIERYLAFVEEAREDDPFWREYCAWKKIADSRFTLAEKLKLYSMKR